MFGIICILLVLVMGVSAMVIWNSLQPVENSDEIVEFTIESGMGTTQIAKLLQEKALIKNDIIFIAYLKYKDQGSRFQAGTYRITPGTNNDELIAMFNNGDVVKEDMIRFTIPEGFTVEQLINKLEEEGIVDGEVMLKLLDDPSTADAALVDTIPSGSDAELKHVLEGYLFPETYELKKGVTEEEIIKTMTAQLLKEINTIENFEQKLKDRDLTLHELLTIASLVEREVVVDHERSLVAGVIYNRLNEGQKLEIDATVQYALDQPKERLFYKDLEIESPYNTYLVEGLPPGPISNPSLASIEAALQPESTEYFYYVTKKDGSQEHLFGKTYKEHLKNIEKSKSTTQ
ncbi:endolytic transglycosylase MltG [Paenibacillus crassostreae]|uniref:Endolytic murein transglycosylase n=1 Tax=Paenibacillus crassostreae TaxID=1763538 RepID=A0A162KSJ0_9BACL|nr:endolytic transglycosylase MltG [Paenibacillus crassostreae]AOZ91854.1 aminodeoxychorismate lyase [Paenibacillus crassostreae]OAB73223.1 aminodeoxychorismate lyase [Paenibacillus crassostreae]